MVLNKFRRMIIFSSSIKDIRWHYFIRLAAFPFFRFLKAYLRSSILIGGPCRYFFPIFTGIYVSYFVSGIYISLLSFNCWGKTVIIVPLLSFMIPFCLCPVPVSSLTILCRLQESCFRSSSSTSLHFQIVCHPLLFTLLSIALSCFLTCF